VLALTPLIERLQTQQLAAGGNVAPAELMTLDARGDSLRARLFISSLRWNSREGDPRLQDLTGILLLGE